MSWAKNLKAGDTVFVSSRGTWSKGQREVKVTKVGRKWVSLENGDRFDLSRDGPVYRVDQNYGLPDSVYQNAEAYELKVKANRLRFAVKGGIQDATDEQIAAIASILGIDIVPASDEVK